VVTCRDGDPGCDAAPAEAGCTFGVALCTAVDDPRLPACRPARPVTLHAAGALARVAPAGVFADVTARPCTAAVPVHVAARRRMVLRVDASAPDGTRDGDVVTLRCRPARPRRSARG
jgi:hypothetical protein